MSGADTEWTLRSAITTFDTPYLPASGWRHLKESPLKVCRRPNGPRPCPMQYIMICHSRRNASHGASAAALWALIVMYVCGTRESEATIGPLSGEWSPPALKVCMITMTTLNHEYVAGEDGQFSFEVAMATQAAYAARHGYPFFLSAVVPPGDEPHDKRLDWGRLYNIQRLQRQASGLCEWFFALEGDVIITNHSFDLSTVFNLAGNASFIINRDLAGNLNTGLYFVRSTPLAQDMMSFIASTRFSHKHDIRVKGWGFNGGTMVRLRMLASLHEHGDGYAFIIICCPSSC